MASSLAFLILSFPFTVFVSPFVAIMSHASLMHDCNHVIQAQVKNINRIDALQCNIDAYVYAYNYNMTLPILCKDIAACKHALMNPHKNPKLANECTNIHSAN